MISMDDRISEVLARDERLVDVLTAFSPHFAKLRDPRLRRMMGRLVTVRQAAGIAGVDPDLLLDALNGRPPAGYGDASFEVVTSARDGVATGSNAALTGDPGFVSGLGPEQVVDLDVREDLRAGREPFSRIMAAVGALREGSVLRLRAIFEPIPLYAVLEKRGFAHWTERLAEDDWRVWFFPSALADEPADAALAEMKHEGYGPDHRETGAPIPAASNAPSALRIDVRGLEPPEPMVRTLAALEDLPPGGVLVQTNVRVPRFLIEELDRRGFSHDVKVVSTSEVEVTIRRPL